MQCRRDVRLSHYRAGGPCHYGGSDRIVSCKLLPLRAQQHMFTREQGSLSTKERGKPQSSFSHRHPPNSQQGTDSQSAPTWRPMEAVPGMWRGSVLALPEVADCHPHSNGLPLKGPSFIGGLRGYSPGLRPSLWPVSILSKLRMGARL